MKKNGSISDQLNTWSANARNIDLFLAPSSQEITAPASTSGAGTAGLAHRTLQALRQTRLQMRTGPWPWAQALSLGLSHRSASGDGLRAAGVQRPSRSVPQQLPTHPHNPRRVGSDQSGTAAPPRGLLSHDGEQGDPAAHRDSRPVTGSHPDCQYARSLARPRAPSLCQRGGKP